MSRLALAMLISLKIFAMAQPPDKFEGESNSASSAYASGGAGSFASGHSNPPLGILIPPPIWEGPPPPPTKKPVNSGSINIPEWVSFEKDDSQESPIQRERTLSDAASVASTVTVRSTKSLWGEDVSLPPFSQKTEAVLEAIFATKAVSEEPEELCSICWDPKNNPGALRALRCSTQESRHIICPSCFDISPVCGVCSQPIVRSPIPKEQKEIPQLRILGCAICGKESSRRSGYTYRCQTASRKQVTHFTCKKCFNQNFESANFTPICLICGKTINTKTLKRHNPHGMLTSIIIYCCGERGK